nr:insecticidal protein IPD113 [Pteris cretica var. albolineata]UYW48184.1 insecticidal protein [Pteris cretica]
MDSDLIAQPPDDNAASVGAPAAEKVQEDQLVVTTPEMEDSDVDPQFEQEMINISALIAAGAVEGHDDVDLFAKYMQVEAHDWQNRLRQAILGLTLAIPNPIVGLAISGFIRLLWPANKVSIWEALNAEQYITNIVQQELMQFEMRTLQSRIEALQTTIHRYDQAAATTEKGNFLSNWITQADGLLSSMRNSSNRIHLLLHIVTVAALHMAALHERLTFGEELYGLNDTASWQRALVEMFEEYTIKLIPTIFKEWRPWRERQIEINEWRQRGQSGVTIFRPDSSHATVQDKLSGELFTFRVNYQYSTTIFSGVTRDHRTRMINEAIADMASCISPTFALHMLLPDDVKTRFSPYDRGLFGRVSRGPYSQDLLQQLFTSVKDFRSHPRRFDQTARDRVVKVIIRAGHHVDAIQFWYDHVNSNSTTTGIMAGNSSGGIRHEIDVKDRPIHELRMEFSHNVLASLQLHFQDGTATQKFGNVNGWASRIATCTAPYSYKLSSWAFREDPGPYNTTAISVLRFDFTPEDPSS